MEEYKDFISVPKLRRLFESIGKEQGALDGTEVSEENWNKVEWRNKGQVGDGKPGDKVEIIWDSESDGMVDKGYVFTLPGHCSDDIISAGIVHIPYPAGGQKDQPEPEWHSLAELCDNKLVKKIIIG